MPASLASCRRSDIHITGGLLVAVSVLSHASRCRLYTLGRRRFAALVAHPRAPHQMHMHGGRARMTGARAHSASEVTEKLNFRPFDATLLQYWSWRRSMQRSQRLLCVHGISAYHSLKLVS